MESKNELKFYCLQIHEETKSVWKAPHMSLLLKQFNIKTVFDCRAQTGCKNLVFNKKYIRRLCKGQAAYVYSNRIARSESFTEAVLTGEMAACQKPILILTVSDSHALRPRRVRDALHIAGHSVGEISVQGMNLACDDFDPSVEKVVIVPEKEEVIEAAPEPDRVKLNGKGERIKVNGERTLGMGKDGVIHSAGLIVTRNGKNGTEVLAIVRSRNNVNKPRELAKGRVEKGETFAECAIRELQEETGCKNPQVLDIEWKHAYVTTYPYRRQKKGIHTKKVFWFYAFLPETETLKFGTREEATQLIEWISPNTENKSIDIQDALLQMRFAAHSKPMGHINEKRIESRQPPRFSLNDPETYLSFLEEHGFVVIADVLSSDEVEEAKGLFWDWMEGLGSGIDRNDINTWINKKWPAKARFGTGVIHTCGIGQSDLQWYTRTRPAVRQVFENIWETKELLTSYDGCAAWRPWHANEAASEWKTTPSWLHVDQNPATNVGKECFQGQVTLTSSTPMTGGFTCIPGSHKVFPEFHEPFKKCNQKLWRLNFKGIKKHPVQKMERIHVCCEAGDMIIWDSRTMHASTHAFEQPDTSPNDLLRLTSFVCMTPRLDSLSNAFLGKRAAAIENYDTTSHVPYEWHATDDLNTSNNTRSKFGLSMMKISKRKREVPEGAYALISGYEPSVENSV